APGDEVARVVAQHRAKIGRSGEADRAAVALRAAHRAPERRIAAIGGAHDADPPGVGDALLHQPIDAVVDIVDHASTPLAVAALGELAAITGRAAEIGLQHRIAA